MAWEPVADRARSADSAAAEPIVGIGQQLREARLAMGMSVREMARRVDVSASFISQLELGKTKPSVGTLYSIASELGVSLDDLMRTAQPAGEHSAPASGVPVEQESAAVAAVGAEVGGRPASPAGAARAALVSRAFRARSLDGSPVQRANCRQELHIGEAIWGRLTADHDPANDFLHVVYKPGGESCPPNQMIHHRGFEYGYIITGQLHVQVGFTHYDLDPGDSISFDSATPHRLSNPFDRESTSIWVVVGRGGTPVL
jgi:transcriptional regulator with XRE-family HTH domain/mannose-6-phosphate isomerase-like protein (cupin superfamily)